MDPYKSQIEELIRQGLLKVALEMRNVPTKVCCSSLKISLEEIYNGTSKKLSLCIVL
jgi:hypothetical protein